MTEYIFSKQFMSVIDLLCDYPSKKKCFLSVSGFEIIDAQVPPLPFTLLCHCAFLQLFKPPPPQKMKKWKTRGGSPAMP